MRIRSLTAYEVPIRLRRPVRHASYYRTHNETLIVRCELSDGSIGWGEGLPRPYVTGETIETVREQLAQTDFSQIADVRIDDLPSVADALQNMTLASIRPESPFAVRGCLGNSVRCAVELSVLDAVCRSMHMPLGRIVEQLPGLTHLAGHTDEVYYSGVITSETAFRHFRSCLKMRLFGFRHVKLKVGSEIDSDVAVLARARWVLGKRTSLRLDANEAWDADTLVRRLESLQPYRPECVEQPLPHGQVAALAELRNQISVDIMLDESLCSEADARHAIQHELCDAFNLRLSKCGGFLNCLRLASLARQNRISYQLGCQVGETGILSAAGRQFACNVREIRYLEGSYDRFLVRERLTLEDLTFGYGGRAAALNRPGLGVTVDSGRVESISKWRRDLLPC